MQSDGVVSPEIGHWYCGASGQLFEVVAIDEMNGAIELQHFDGTLEEADADTWPSMQAAAAEPPEDWSGSVDVSDEDLASAWRPLTRDWQSAIETADRYRSDVTSDD